MTLASNYDPIKQATNGQTTSFTFDFDLIDESYLEVYLETDGEQTLVDDSDYTVSFETSGGNVNFKTAPAAGSYVIISRKVPMTQETEYKTSSGFPAVRVEQDLDKLTAITQQLQDASDRSLKTALGSNVELTLPPSAPGKVLVWNDEGNGFVNSQYNPDDAGIFAEQAQQSAISAANSASKASASVNNAQIWAEGTDEQVQELGGTHSAKGWVEQIDVSTYQKLENITIPVASWTESTSGTTYPYSADYNVSGLTDDNITDVYFNEADATSGNYSPVTSTTSGKFTIYAKEMPAENIILPSVLIF